MALSVRCFFSSVKLFEPITRECHPLNGETLYSQEGGKAQPKSPLPQNLDELEPCVIGPKRLSPQSLGAS